MLARMALKTKSFPSEFMERGYLEDLTEKYRVLLQSVHLVT